MTHAVLMDLETGIDLLVDLAVGPVGPAPLGASRSGVYTSVPAPLSCLVQRTDGGVELILGGHRVGALSQVQITPRRVGAFRASYEIAQSGLSELVVVRFGIKRGLKRLLQLPDAEERTTVDLLAYAIETKLWAPSADPTFAWVPVLDLDELPRAEGS